MEALHDVVKAGKARYIGASSMWAWQFTKMQHTADRHGWTRFISMQNQYSLLQREEEREMFGLLADQKVGSIPWSPRAKGALPGHGPTTPLRAPKPTPCRPAMSARPTNRPSGCNVSPRLRRPYGQVAVAWVLITRRRPPSSARRSRITSAMLSRP